jgi:hypothetical protein
MDARSEAREKLADLSDETQLEVSRLLASLPDPGPMPAHLEERILMSLAAAAETRAADRELFDELGMVEDDAEPEFENAFLFSDRDARDPVASPEGPRRGPHEMVRRRWPLLAAAAAAVVAVGAIGTAALSQLRSGSDGLASLPGSSGTASQLDGRVHVQVSTTAYTKASLPAGARTLLDAPGPEASSGDAPSVGPLATDAGVDACLEALGVSDASAVSVDLATYEGQPAAIVVATQPDRTLAYAVGRECTTGDPQVVQEAVPVP